MSEIEHEKLLVINGTDYTGNCTAPDYKVNAEYVYNNWTDGNGLVHHDIYRTKISGTIKMKFINLEDYFNFVNILKSNTTAGGYVNMTVYVINFNITANIDAFVEFQPKDDLPFIPLTDDYDGFDLKITER